MRKSKSNSRKLQLVVLGLVIFILGVVIGSSTQTETYRQITTDIFVSTEEAGYIPVEISISGNTLSFSSQCRKLSFEITNDQAFSVERGLEGIVDARPLTHDLVIDSFENFGIKIISAKIDEYNNGVYYAKLLMKQDTNILELDVRPSDASAIAVRTGIPFTIKEEIINAYGINTCA